MNRSVLALLALSVSAPAADLTIDHVTFAGRNLSSLEAALKSAGIHVEYGGRHTNRATEMAIASFGDGSYLELIALQPNADPSAVSFHHWSKYMRGDAGPCAWAVRAPDFDREVSRLRSAGVDVEPIVNGARTRPDGLTVRWQTAQVGAEGSGVFYPFLIHDFTDRAQRAFPGGKPNNPEVAGVGKVVIAVRDLNAAIARMRQAYGLGAPEPYGGLHDVAARAVAFPETPILLASASSPRNWLGRRLEEFGEGVTAFLLEKKDGGTIWVKPPEASVPVKR